MCYNAGAARVWHNRHSAVDPTFGTSPPPRQQLEGSQTYHHAPHSLSSSCGLTWRPTPARLSGSWRKRGTAPPASSVSSLSEAPKAEKEGNERQLGTAHAMHVATSAGGSEPPRPAVHSAALVFVASQFSTLACCSCDRTPTLLPCNPLLPCRPPRASAYGMCRALLRKTARGFHAGPRSWAAARPSLQLLQLTLHLTHAAAPLRCRAPTPLPRSLSKPPLQA